MSFNLLDAVKGYFSSDLISKASSFLGESEGGVTKALGGIVPSVLGGLLNKGGSAEGAGSLLKMATEAHGSGILGNLGNFFGDGGGLLSKGADLVKGLFGDKAGGLVDGIASFAGIKSSSVSSVMSMAAPVALGALGKHATENNLDAGGLSSFLSSQKSSILSSLPSGLGSLAGMLGLGAVGDKIASATGAAKETAGAAVNYAGDAARKAGGGMKWLLPLLLLALAAVAAWYLFGKGCSSPSATPGKDTLQVNNDSPGSNKPTAPATGARESMKVKLADGTEIEAYKGGIEDQLVGFIGNAGAAIDTAKGNWFDFDNLNFKVGSSELTPESMGQVKNIAAILKAYPKVKIKIGGYTDKTGNEADNVKLSGARATVVMNAIIANGGNKAQLDGAEGYGSKFAKADATASDEERKKDRKIAVRVKAK
jgi:outer membrane protein OmpA-like peptidoglycan-associated protein